MAIRLVQAFARRKVVLVLCLEIEPKFFNLVIVTLLLWRIPHLYVQFHLWEKKKIIVSISCEFLSILCLEIEPLKFFNTRRHNCDLALIPRLRFWKRKKEGNSDSSRPSFCTEESSVGFVSRNRVEIFRPNFSTSSSWLCFYEESLCAISPLKRKKR